MERFSPLAEGNDVHPLLVILALLASLNATTNPWIYLCFSSAMLQQVKVRERANEFWCLVAWEEVECCAYVFFQHVIGLHSTYGGPDSLGGADADQENAILAKRILFRKKENQREDMWRNQSEVALVLSTNFTKWNIWPILIAVAFPYIVGSAGAKEWGSVSSRKNPVACTFIVSSPLLPPSYAKTSSQNRTLWKARDVSIIVDEFQLFFYHLTEPYLLHTSHFHMELSYFLTSEFSLNKNPTSIKYKWVANFEYVITVFHLKTQQINYLPFNVFQGEQLLGTGACMQPCTDRGRISASFCTVTNSLLKRGRFCVNCASAADSLFTCGEARRSMDDNYSPYNILEMMAYRGHKDMGT